MVKQKYTYYIDFLVGLFVCIGLVALLFFALKVSRISYQGKKTYTVEAYFDNVGTLKTGASVKSSGVIVGNVKEILFNDTVFRAQIKITLDPKYKFPKDSQLKIATAGLLGDQYLNIDAGSDSEILKQGDVVDNTESAIVLEDLIGKLLYSKAHDMGKNKATTD
jgi:phospholipid/cholesterol/gamma-HCH transport system substrate-binding protein